jgi:hypothetical protein
MTQPLQDGVRLNLKTLEALAAGRVPETERSLAAADENPQLFEAAAARRTARRQLTDFSRGLRGQIYCLLR